VVAVCREAYNLLYAVNKQLLDGLVSDDSSRPLMDRVAVDAVGRVDWLTAFKPLSHADMDAVFASVLDADSRFAHGEMIRNFLHYDAALLVVIPHPTTNTMYKVFPASLALLLAHVHTPLDYTAAQLAHTVAVAASGARQAVATAVVHADTYRTVAVSGGAAAVTGNGRALGSLAS